MNRRTWCIAAALLLGACGKKEAAPTEVTLAAATSLRAVLPALIAAYQAGHPGTHLQATYGASGDLKKQVEGGAPIDGVIFASAAPVDALGDRVDGKQVVATNTLILIGPKGSKPLTFATLDTLPAGEHVAIGEPGAVPAGQYARDYLQKLGKWDTLQGRLVLGGDVAAVLAYARRGEAAAAIVYRTEARGIADVTVLDEAKGPLAPRPEVVAATVKGSRASAAAASFLGFVVSPEARKIWADFGFGPP